MDKLGAHGRTATFNSAAIKRGQVSVRVLVLDDETSTQKIGNLDVKHELDHQSGTSELSTNDHMPQKKKLATNTRMATRNFRRKPTDDPPKAIPDATDKRVFEQRSAPASPRKTHVQPSSPAAGQKQNRRRDGKHLNSVDDSMLAGYGVLPTNENPSQPSKANEKPSGRLFASALLSIFQQNKRPSQSKRPISQNEEPAVNASQTPAKAADVGDDIADVPMNLEAIKIVFDTDAGDEFYDANEELPAANNDVAGGDFNYLNSSRKTAEADDAFYTAASTSPFSGDTAPYHAVSPNEFVDFPENDCGCGLDSGDASRHYSYEVDGKHDEQSAVSLIDGSKIGRVHALFDSARKNIGKKKHQNRSVGADAVRDAPAPSADSSTDVASAVMHESHTPVSASSPKQPKKQQQQRKLRIPATEPQQTASSSQPISSSENITKFPADAAAAKSAIAIPASPPKQQLQRFASPQQQRQKVMPLSPNKNSNKIVTAPSPNKNSNAVDAGSTSRVAVSSPVSLPKMKFAQLPKNSMLQPHQQVMSSQDVVSNKVDNGNPKTPVAAVSDKKQQIQMIFEQHRSTAASSTSTKSAVAVGAPGWSAQTHAPTKSSVPATPNEKKLETMLLDSNGRRQKQSASKPNDSNANFGPQQSCVVVLDHTGRKQKKHTKLNAYMRRDTGEQQNDAYVQQPSSLSQLSSAFDSFQAAARNVMLSTTADEPVRSDIGMTSPSPSYGNTGVLQNTGPPAASSDNVSRNISTGPPSRQHRRGPQQPSPTEATATTLYDSNGRKRNSNSNSKATLGGRGAPPVENDWRSIPAADSSSFNYAVEQKIAVRREQDTAPAPQYPDHITNHFKMSLPIDSRGRRQPQLRPQQQEQQWRRSPVHEPTPNINKSSSPENPISVQPMSMDMLIERCKRQVAQLLQNSSFSKPAAAIWFKDVQSFDCMRNAAHLHLTTSGTDNVSQPHMPFSDRRDLKIYRMSERRYDLQPNISASTIDAAESNAWGVTSGLIDSHGHVSMTFKKFSDNGIFKGFDKSFSYEKLRQNYAASYPPTFEGQIEVLCSVEHLVRGAEWQRIIDSASGQLALTIGLHPNWAAYWSLNNFKGLRHSSLAASVVEALFALRKHVVAVGEAGLDFRKSNHLGGGGGSKQQPSHAEYETETKRVQKEVFMQQMLLAYALNMPLVIHCRDGDGSVVPDEAYSTAFDMCCAALPSYWPVHVHCYSGSLEVAHKWLKHFARAKIGFVPLRSFSDAELKSIGQQYRHFTMQQPQQPTMNDAVAVFNRFNCRELPNTSRNNDEEWNRARLALFVGPERMLLETDAPFFIPKQVEPCDVELQQQKIALAGAFVKYTAKQVAALKCMPERDVIVAHRKNVRELYGV